MSIAGERHSFSPKTASNGRRLRQALVVSPLLVGNAVMLALCLLGFQVLSATRAYVGGESHWSKGRTQAVQQLREYARTGDRGHLQAYKAALDAPLGDREARLEMEKPEPDPARISQGFIRGGVSPEDVPAMARLYRWFGDSQLMSDSVTAWRVADVRILMMQTIGARLETYYAQRGDGAAADPEIAEAVQSLDSLEAELRALELKFSSALGEASRSTFRILSLLIALSTLTLTLTTFVLVRHGMQQQRRYELALEDANKRWSLAADGEGLGLFEWRPREDTVHMDANARVVYGLDADPEAGPVPRAELRQLILPEDEALLRAKLEQAVSKGEVFHHLYRIRPPRHQADESERYVEVNSVMRGTVAGGDRRMIGIVRNVSTRIRQEQAELDRATAERTATARTEFLSRLSHELRTPLNAVLGFSDLLVLDPAEPLTPRQLQRVQLITDAGRHLLHLVDDVLDISGIDSGRLSVERVATPLGPVLQAAAVLASAEQQEFGIRLEIAELPQGTAVWGDARRLGQVLANLLSNGFKYNRPGGIVKVDVQHRVLDGRQRIRIDVHDQGSGLDEDQLQQLFQAFKRLPGAAHRRGTGLGLTIVKLLVEQMGGSIEVSSTVGEGSVFSVTLEAAPTA
jgi:signal transduction histidine kinase